MGIEEGAVAVDGADAVAVAVGAETGVEFSGEDGFASGSMCGSMGSGCAPPKRGSRVAANFVADNFITGEKFAQQAGGGTVHGVGRRNEI